MQSRITSIRPSVPPKPIRILRESGYQARSEFCVNPATRNRQRVVCHDLFLG
ncbi:hypothetical protein RISK_006456 [Rhodopirellula islandica]|uniref:Uncharacterized protein n=1 Tax=Rhodopirellula islandica TaxID=595434 RepID=A0A0J1B314_RHOIS|nr:hypothetical protein RISK_006456 [Rhodopirellula islandica]